MKKRILLILGILLCTTGCTSVNQDNINHIINSTIETPIKVDNIQRAGYKYYLPGGMRLLKEISSNELLAQNRDLYYLYVDYVSYFKKVKSSYTENKDAYFSKQIQNNDLFGYIEIKNTTKNKYFIEIMYNYAKIEVIVDKENINKSVAYSLSILSSIQYQDTVLKNLMGENVLDTNEVEHNIFETAKTESEYLQIVEEYGQYEEDTTVDPDFIRR